MSENLTFPVHVIYRTKRFCITFKLSNLLKNCTVGHANFSRYLAAVFMSSSFAAHLRMHQQAKIIIGYPIHICQSYCKNTRARFFLCKNKNWNWCH